jgi:hypothetical protein
MSESIISAPYETTATAAFTAFGEWAGFMETISPAVSAWILANIEAHKGIKAQRIMDRRLRKCKRICRRGRFNASMVKTQVTLDFADMPEKIDSIVQLIIEEINQ